MQGVNKRMTFSNKINITQILCSMFEKIITEKNTDLWLLRTSLLLPFYDVHLVLKHYIKHTHKT